MKIVSNIFSIILLLVLFSGCGKDNFDAPESKLVGRVTYQGQALNVRGTGEAVQLQLYQDGYEKNDPISVFVGQDGTFSALLFDGEYRLTTRDGNGPWVNSHESVTVHLNGHTEVNLEVTPYFTISNEQLSVAGSVMNASFTINQIVPEAKISRVMLLLSKTQFADDVNNLFRQDFSDVTPGSMNLSANIGGNTEIAKAKALYARVGVLANGADQAIYSPVVRLK
ncbi:DUF3823 domain-containing protein [Parabacteroides sp. ASD2025]|uniref:DUF3823 domain-containing protein n=1 Tax=Parabacteroides sp. ASD2025 TaxID=3415987 RepID=UPI003CF4335E